MGSGEEERSSEQAEAEAATASEQRRCCASCRAVYRRAYARCPRDGGELAPLTEDPLIGMDVGGRYRVEECIGEGAMGRVYRARHGSLGREFAIKILFGDVAADDKMRARFANEAEAASRLCHPNVVPTLDFGHIDDELPFLAMEYARGRSLADIICAEAPLAVGRALSLARGILAGLAHAHGRGLVHRDVKPLNILVEATPDGGETPRLVDFGLAIAPTSADRVGRLTTVGLVIGTPTYMAPEQACDLPVDHRADLFSVGVVLYEMLAGVPPFEGTPIEVAHHNANAIPPPIAERNPEVRVPAPVEALVHKLMSKWPEDRFTCAGEVVEALEQIAAGGDREAVAIGAGGAPSDAERGSGRRPQRRLGLAGAAAAMMVVMLVGGRLWIRGTPPQPQPRPQPRAAAAARDPAPGRRCRQNPPAPNRAKLAATASRVLDLARRTAPELFRRAGADTDVHAPLDLDSPSLPPPARDPLSWLPPIARTIARRRRGRGSGARGPRRVSRRASARVASSQKSRHSRRGARRSPPPPPRGRRHRRGTTPRPLARELLRAYRSTGEALDQLARLRGDQAAAPYRRGFFAIDLGEALRSPRSRRRALRRLQALSGQVARQLARTLTRRDPRGRR